MQKLLEPISLFICRCCCVLRSHRLNVFGFLCEFSSTWSSGRMTIWKWLQRLNFVFNELSNTAISDAAARICSFTAIAAILSNLFVARCIQFVRISNLNAIDWHMVNHTTAILDLLELSHLTWRAIVCAVPGSANLGGSYSSQSVCPFSGDFVYRHIPAKVWRWKTTCKLCIDICAVAESGLTASHDSRLVAPTQAITTLPLQATCSHNVRTQFMLSMPLQPIWAFYLFIRDAHVNFINNTLSVQFSPAYEWQHCVWWCERVWMRCISVWLGVAVFERTRRTYGIGFKLPMHHIIIMWPNPSSLIP